MLFGSGVALLSYVLEVFGETNLSGGEMLGLLSISAALLAAYGLHTKRTVHPLLRLKLLGIRTFRVSVSGNLFTRLGIGGIPFLLPLLYQVGLGFSPIQSGLLIMPQAIAAMSLKLTMPLDPEAIRLPDRVDHQHPHARLHDHAVRHHRYRARRYG